VPDSEEYGILVHCFDKNRSTKVCIHVQEYLGSVFLNIREFYRDRASGEWRPSRRGVTVPPDLYPELLHGVVSAADALGLDPDSTE